jgi:hypothetical protein
MNQDQFLAEDSRSTRDDVTDQQRTLERRVVIRRFKEYVGGDVIGGTSPQRVDYLIEASFQFRMMTGKDILSSGGIYALGDMEGTSQMPVFAADDRANHEPDFMTLDGHTYMIIGKPFPVPMAGGAVFYRSVWRRKA